MRSNASRAISVQDTGLIGLWFGDNYGAIMTTYSLYRLLEKPGKSPLLLGQPPLTGYAARSKPYVLSYVPEPGAAIRQHTETIAAERGEGEIIGLSTDIADGLSEMRAHRQAYQKRTAYHTRNQG